MIRRREFLTLLGGAAAAWPVAARAQQGERMRRIGVLSSLPGDDPEIVARAIDAHQNDSAYDQVVVGYMLQIADELSTDDTRIV